MNELLQCGCSAQAVCSAKDGVEYDPPIPCCPIHECYELAEVQPDLTGRTARCTYSSCRQNLARYHDTHYGELRADGRSYAPSSLKLPFFQYKPGEEYDEYFCGCMGWD